MSVKYVTSNDNKKGLLAKINNKGLHKPIENVHKVKGNQLLIGTAMDENAFFAAKRDKKKTHVHVTRIDPSVLMESDREYVIKKLHI